MVTRRHFLKATGSALGGGVVATLAGGFQTLTAKSQQPSRVRERKNVSGLNPTSPDIVALVAAVRAMHNLPAADARSWEQQARIHGDILGDQFNHCQHGNWWFLPWHRCYLYYFEEIVRQLSGNEDFAIPYWDWSSDFQLPPLFAAPGSPLDNPPRPGQPGSGRLQGPGSTITPSDQRQFVNRTVISGILRPGDFTLFAGDEVANLSQGAAAGTLEGTPHNFIHRWVGGDMVTAGSPYDPVFWLHHCNIDRLWAEWVRRHPGSMPNDNTWLDTPFANHFCDRQGTPVAASAPQKPVTTREVLNTEDIGYRYEQRPGPLAFGLARPEQFVRTPGPSATQARLADGVVTYELISTPAVSSRVGASLEKNEHIAVRLRLTGIRIPRDRDVAIRVYVNCPRPGPDVPLTDPSYVTSVTFFHGPHGGDRHGGPGTVSFLVDLTPALDRLYADRPFRTTEPVNVSLVAKALFPEHRRAWTGSIEDVRPEQVSLDVISRKS